MQYVQPIRSKKKIDDMKTFLRGKNLRDYCLFVLGVNSGLRVSDLLSLRVSDVITDGQPTSRISLYEQKTGKYRNFAVGVNAQRAISEYLATRPDAQPSEWLFASERVRRTGKLTGQSVITREYAWQALNDAAQAVGITESIGTHTLRKTFGYWAYRQSGDVVAIMNILNHSHPSVTLRYIGITQDDMDSLILSVNL